MIKIEELEHLAKLARIHLTDQDKTSLLKEFDGILAYVDQLKKVDVSLDAEGRIGSVKNVMRDDVVQDTLESKATINLNETRDAILAEAPDRVGDYIAVKKIIEQ